MEALDRGDVARLANALPRSEHWRLFEAFGADAAYLDIETGDDVWGHESISAIGFFDRAGPRLLLAGRDLHLFPELAQSLERPGDVQRALVRRPDPAPSLS